MDKLEKRFAQVQYEKRTRWIIHCEKLNSFLIHSKLIHSVIFFGYEYKSVELIKLSELLSKIIKVNKNIQKWTI